MTSSHPEPPLSTREEQRRYTRVRITRAARAVFEEYGYGGASIGVIAATANVNRATFYLHFPDKAAVFNEVFADLMKEAAKYWARLDEALSVGTSASMRAWLSAAMKWWEDHPAILQAMHEAMAVELDVAGQWKTALDGLATELHSYLDNFPAHEQEDIRLRVELLIVQLDQACLRFIIQGVFPIDRDHLIDVLTDFWCSTLGLDKAS